MKATRIVEKKESKKDSNTIYDIVFVLDDMIQISGIQIVLKKDTLEFNWPNNIYFLDGAVQLGVEADILRSLQSPEVRDILQERKKPKSHISRYVDKALYMIKNKKY